MLISFLLLSFVLAQQIALDIRELKVPSTHIRIFLNPQLVLFEFTTLPVHTWRIQIEFACLHDGIDPDSLKYPGLLCDKMCSERAP